MITFTDVSKEFFGRTVLQGVSFAVQPGEFVCITGPSGAGKSTLVHLLIRAENPTSGTIDVDGADLSLLPTAVLQMYRRATGVLFQDYKLLADRTVAENIAFPLEVCEMADADIEQRLSALLARLGLTELRDAFPHELSGGEKTRTALGRALVAGPSILIADEPTGNLDPQQAQEILTLLKDVNRDGTTVILATHDQYVVDALGGRVIRLERGKLIRDSVGGYAAESVIARAPVPADSEALTMPSLSLAPKTPKQDGGSAKIKPIAI